MTRSKRSRQSRVSNRLADLERKLAAATLMGATSVAASSNSSRASKSRNRRVRRRRAGVPRMVAGAERRLVGTDIIGSVEIVTSSLSPGSGLFKLDLSPRSFTGTRLAAESQLWTRWRPTSLVARLVSNGTSLVPGRMSLGWSADPGIDFPTGNLGVLRMGTLVPHQTTQCAVPAEIRIPSGIPGSAQRWYLCTGSSEDKDHGTLIAIALSPFAGNIGKVSFQIELDYTIEFMGPDLQTPTDSDTIYAESDYASYFTDSVSDWAGGKKLSLKEREGGNLVPFPDARPGVIYQIDTKAVLKYYTSDKTTLKMIGYGVRIPNYYSSALAVFDDKDKAAAFAKTGDSANCLDYFASGPRVEPDNPAWRQISDGFHCTSSHPQRPPR